MNACRQFFGCWPLVILFGAAAAQLLSQNAVYMITGSPSPNIPAEYASTLIRLENGALTTIAELAEGTVFVDISYDWRKAVVWTNEASKGILVIPFDRGTIAKACVNPPIPFAGLMDQWLLDSPSGPRFVQLLVGDDVSNGELRAMALEESVSCEDSFGKIQPAEMRFFATHGQVGVAQNAGATFMRVHMDSEGNLSNTFNREPVDFGARVPAEMLNGVARPIPDVTLVNRKVFGLGIGDMDNRENARLLVLRRRDGTWHRVPLGARTIYSGWVFENYIAFAESFPKGEGRRESAGAAEWRKKDGRSGPHIWGKFESGDAVYTGRLLVYNIESGKLLTVVTNQGDSEILLIEDGMIYYRVSDRLFSATLTDVAIGRPTLLSRDERILDAHWAFRSRAGGEPK